ncbi:hypothetical protein [Actinomyces massiliensis]|uniref:hypothetical protein n=1 Tax=Actinomyces massiliensis TaxID=461393 RepID=UPI0028E396B3|nr:hypothetical protein [Actinomyces massiliensis]
MNRMSGLPAWSAVYAAFDDVALEALANRGLLRRGRVEVAAGRVGVQEAGRPTGSANEMVAESTESAESAETLTVAVGRPAVPVVLTAGGPQEARCPCPVAGVCIHVVAACLWMREAVAAEAPAEPDPGGPAAAVPGTGGAAENEQSVGPSESRAFSGEGVGTAGTADAEDAEDAEDAANTAARGEDEDPVLAEVLAWEPAVVEKALGVAALRRVTAALAGTDPDILAADTLVTRAPGRLSVTWPNAPEVVVIAGLGPRGMIVAGRHSQVVHAAWRLQAVVRLFARAGRAWPWPTRKIVLSADQRRLLASAAAAVEGLIAAGISHAGPRSADELDRLAQAARLEEIPRLARLLTSTAAAVHAVARRDDAMDESAALSALAAAWSLTRALEATSAAPDPALLGRADAERVQPGLLMPLSATWWLAPSGSRGLTARFWDMENRRLESVTTGRAAGADPTFHCADNIPLVWGASVRALLSGPLRLTGATRRTDGVLAPSARTTVRHCGGYDDIDLAAIAHELRALQRGPGAAGFEAPLPPVRLMLPDPSGLGRIDLDEIHQQYVWPVCDTAGEEHLLRLVPDSTEAALIAAVLTRDLPVVAMTVEGDRPAGIYVRREGGLALLSPSISSIRAGRIGFYHRLAERLERLRAETAAPTPPPSASGLIESLCEDLREALTALAASGALRAQGRTAHVLTSRARWARELQLETLAAALTRVEDEPGPQAILRACAVVDRIRALTR